MQNILNPNNFQNDASPFSARTCPNFRWFSKIAFLLLWRPCNIFSMVSHRIEERKIIIANYVKVFLRNGDWKITHQVFLELDKARTAG